MTDNFALLNEPRRPWLDAEKLKERFFVLSAEVHPDRVHQSSESEKLAANQRYTSLNEAYNCLREPRERLRHLLELELGNKPSDLTNVPNDLMDLFFEIGKVFRETDAFLAEKSRASSPMLQVQLFERGQDWVEKLGAVRLKISRLRDGLHEEIRKLDGIWEVVSSSKGREGWGDEASLALVKIPSPQPSPRLGGEREMTPALPRFQPKPLERLLEIWRLLSFYERWLAQIQERVLELSF